jgi:hypothetical protein
LTQSSSAGFEDVIGDGERKDASEDIDSEEAEIDFSDRTFFTVNELFELDMLLFKVPSNDVPPLPRSMFIIF